MKDKRVKKSLYLLAPILIMLWANSLADLPPDWDALKAAAGNIRTLKADFSQNKHLKFLKAPLISKGRLYYSAPDFLRWEYVSPIKSVILKDGDKARVYQFLEGAWKADVIQGVEVRNMIFSEINNWLKGRFTEGSLLSASYSSGPPIRVTLTPGDELRNFLDRIELIFSDKPGIIKSVTLIEPDGAHTRIEFTHVQINAPIPTEIFKKP
jgi:outer membrane lipoprotein-sorting protein